MKTWGMNFSFFIGIVLLASVTGQHWLKKYCPPKKSYIAPCTCEVKIDNLEVKCHVADYSEVKDKVHNYVQDLMDIWLYLQQENIPAKFLGDVNVEYLNIFDSTLKTIDENAFSGIEKYLKSVSISDGKLKYMFAPAFRHLKIDYLGINKNADVDKSLVSVKKSDTDNLPDTLVEAVFTRDRIVSIENGSFLRFDALKKLSFSFNEIKTIGANAIPPNLEYLSLRKNSLTEIPTEAFNKGKNGLVIYLNGNNITHLPKKADMMKLLKKNMKFSLYSNPVRCTCDMTYVGEFNQHNSKNVYGRCNGDKYRDKLYMADLRMESFDDCY